MTLWRHFEDPPARGKSEQADKESETPEGRQRIAFAETARALPSLRPITHTNVAYVLCVAAQALAQLAVMFAALLYFRYHLHNFAPVDLPKSEREALLEDVVQILAALAIIALWFLFNQVKMVQTLRIYPWANDHTRPRANHLLCHVRRTAVGIWCRAYEAARWALSGLAAVAAILKQIFDSYWLLQAGREANPAGYALPPLLVLLIGALMMTPPPQDERGRANPTG